MTVKSISGQLSVVSDLKLANNSGTSDHTLYVDNFTVYSDTQGTTEIFFDDYEDATVGEVLDGTDDSYNSSAVCH